MNTSKWRLRYAYVKPILKADAHFRYAVMFATFGSIFITIWGMLMYESLVPRPDGGTWTFNIVRVVLGLWLLPLMMSVFAVLQFRLKLRLSVEQLILESRDGLTESDTDTTDDE